MVQIIGFMIGFYILARCTEMFEQNESLGVRVFTGIAAVVALLGIVLLLIMSLSGPPDANSPVYFGS